MFDPINPWSPARIQKAFAEEIRRACGFLIDQYGGSVEPCADFLRFAGKIGGACVDLRFPRFGIRFVRGKGDFWAGVGALDSDRYTDVSLVVSALNQERPVQREIFVDPEQVGEFLAKNMPLLIGSIPAGLPAAEAVIKEGGYPAGRKWVY
jgi:hypothetical protein